MVELNKVKEVEKDLAKSEVAKTDELGQLIEQEVFDFPELGGLGTSSDGTGLRGMRRRMVLERGGYRRGGGGVRVGGRGTRGSAAARQPNRHCHQLRASLVLLNQHHRLIVQQLQLFYSWDNLPLNSFAQVFQWTVQRALEDEILVRLEIGEMDAGGCRTTVMSFEGKDVLKGVYQSVGGEEPGDDGMLGADKLHRECIEGLEGGPDLPDQ